MFFIFPPFSRLGRTVTLVKDQLASRVYGMAYEIPASKAKQTFENLNFREKCGYTMIQVDFNPTFDFSTNTVLSSQQQQSPVKCICYYADETNHYYSPSLDKEAMAQQIVTSVGPSGTNREYLYNFCEALRNLFKETQLLESTATHDSHIFELERLVRSLDKS